MRLTSAFPLLTVCCLAAVPVLYADGFDIGPTQFLAPTVTTFDDLSLSSQDTLPYTLNGNTYSSSAQTSFFYGDFGDTGDCYANECIGSSSAEGIMTIDLGSPSARAGFYLGVSQAQVTFYDSNGNEIDSETVTPPELDSSNIWIGWDDLNGLIGSISIQGLDLTHIFTIDNVITDANNATIAPEPGTIGLIALGLAAVLWRKSAGALAD